MTFASRLAAVTFAALMCWTVPASAQQPQPAPYPPPQRQPGPEAFGPDELVSAGHKFFGNVSRGLASVIERAVSQWGLPNGYVLGEEGSGAFVAGAGFWGRTRPTHQTPRPRGASPGGAGGGAPGGAAARPPTPRCPPPPAH